MRHKLAATAAALTVVALTGCGGNADSAGDSSDNTASGKALDVQDNCSLLTEQQRTELELVRPPEERESNGKPGCQYQSAEMGGWGAFVAADPSRTKKDFTVTASEVEDIRIAGFPTAKVDNGSGCMLVVGVSTEGSLFVQTSTAMGTATGTCPQAEKVAEAAVQNLPDA